MKIVVNKAVYSKLWDFFYCLWGLGLISERTRQSACKQIWDEFLDFGGP